jgi:hypothetical protein
MTVMHHTYNLDELQLFALYPVTIHPRHNLLEAKACCISSGECDCRQYARAAGICITMQAQNWICLVGYTSTQGRLLSICRGMQGGMGGGCAMRKLTHRVHGRPSASATRRCPEADCSSLHLEGNVHCEHLCDRCVSFCQGSG